MARWTPVPVAGGAYADDCLPFASQDCVNYIPVMAERPGARSPAMLRGLPGCTTFSVTGSDAPIRGTYNAEGRLLAVTGSSLYRIGTDGAATSLGALPGIGRVSFAHNQIAGGNEIAIANGQSGYIYDTTTETLVQITDPGFPGAKVFGFVDGFLMFVEPRGRFFGWSDLAAGTSYNTLDQSEAESQPDRIVSGIETAGDWMILSERTCEFYRNTGAATGTFQRIEGTALQVGCAGTFCVGKIDNSVIFVDNFNIVRRLDGYTAPRISTHAIEQQLRRCNLANAFVTVFEDDGHKVWYLTCPDGKTWGYDAATGEWHRRRSDGLDRWRMATLTRWNRAWIAGDYANGKLYQLDWAIQHEAGAEMERLRTMPVAHDNGNRITINAVRFGFDTGVDGL